MIPEAGIAATAYIGSPSDADMAALLSEEMKSLTIHLAPNPIPEVARDMPVTPRITYFRSENNYTKLKEGLIIRQNNWESAYRLTHLDIFALRRLRLLRDALCRSIKSFTQAGLVLE